MSAQSVPMSSIASSVRNEKFDIDIRNQLHQEIHGPSAKLVIGTPQYPAGEEIPHMANYNQESTDGGIAGSGGPSRRASNNVRYSVGVSG